MIYGIILIVLGLLAAPSLVLAKKPSAKGIFDKIVPYQDYIGILAVLLGAWDILYAIEILNFLGSGLLGILIWVLIVAMGTIELALGFILGYDLIRKNLLAKNEIAAAKGQALFAKLVPLQERLGLAAIPIGLLYFLLRLILG